MQQAKLYVVASVILLAFTSVNAARKSKGLRRPNSRRPSAFNSASAPSQVEKDRNAVVVQLTRIPARKIGAGAASHASFYVGNMTVGTPPQEFQVLFDTGSGHVLLPHKACKTSVCLEHHQYSPWASTSALDVNDDGIAVQKGHRVAQGPVSRSFASLEFSQADLGDGVAKGVLVRDHVCLSSGTEGHRGHQACTDLSMLAATQEDAMPFAAMPADGIIGLGLEGLAVTALSSFYAGLIDSSHNMLPEFGISLGAEDGKIIFGGRAAVASLAAPLEWFPVSSPKDGMWQVEVLSVRVAGRIINSCVNACHAIVDTSSSRLGVQGKDDLSALRAALATRNQAGKCAGPELEFELPRGLVITLSAEEYASSDCDVEVGALNLDGPQFVGVYSFGTNVLRRYYTAFDWATAQIGFAPSAGSQSLHHLTKRTREASAGSAPDSITV